MSASDSYFDCLNTTIDDFFGETVVYARGAESVKVTAVWNSSRFEFDINQSVLILNSELIEPKTGDSITRATGEQYDVSLEYTDSDGVKVAIDDIADASNSLWRVQVKKVKK